MSLRSRRGRTRVRAKLLLAIPALLLVALASVLWPSGFSRSGQTTIEAGDTPLVASTIETSATEASALANSPAGLSGTSPEVWLALKTVGATIPGTLQTTSAPTTTQASEPTTTAVASSTSSSAAAPSTSYGEASSTSSSEATAHFTSTFRDDFSDGLTSSWKV